MSTREINWLSVRQAADSLPAISNKKIKPEILARWRDRGIKDLAGNRIRLEMTRIGGRWLVDPEKLEAFIEFINAPVPEAPRIRSPKEIEREGRRIDAELDALGV